MADKYPALRVSQLDAAELDHEVLDLTKLHLNNLFKYFQTDVLGRFDPEVTALIKLILWKFTLSDSDATLGQQLLGIRYGQTRGPEAGQWISARHKFWFALVHIACPYLRERLSSILHFLHLTAWEEQTAKCIQNIETGAKVATLVNFLIFLRRGIHLSLTERLLGVTAQFPRQQTLRQVSFEFMTRELLWHGFSELLLFLLPLINIRRMKNAVLRWFAPKGQTWQSAESRSKADLVSCVVCGEWPVCPHHYGCRHVFCYFCLASNLKADPAYFCPVCGPRGKTQHGWVPEPVLLTIGPQNR